MKKYILFLLITLACSFSVFAQEQIDEAAPSEITVEAVETVENQEHFAIGIGLSGLGLEPIFQYRKGNLEMQGSVAFTDFGLYTEMGIKVITPKFDIGYCVTIPDLSMSISTGFANGVFLGISDDASQMAIADIVALYLKVSEQIGKFELGGKIYFPIYGLGYDSGSNSIVSDLFACNATGFMLSAFSFTIEGKIVIK